jgi:hypothetical protein
MENKTKITTQEKQQIIITTTTLMQITLIGTFHLSQFRNNIIKQQTSKNSKQKQRKQMK